MKKLFITSLVMILAVSFFVGVFATDTSAKKSKCDAITEHCDNGVLIECCHRLVTKNDLHAVDCYVIGDC